jgi:hypothetical protein
MALSTCFQDFAGRFFGTRAASKTAILCGYKLDLFATD